MKKEAAIKGIRDYLYEKKGTRYASSRKNGKFILGEISRELIEMGGKPPFRVIRAQSVDDFQQGTERFVSDVSETETIQGDPQVDSIVTLNVSSPNFEDWTVSWEGMPDLQRSPFTNIGSLGGSQELINQAIAIGGGQISGIVTSIQPDDSNPILDSEGNNLSMVGSFQPTNISMPGGTTTPVIEFRYVKSETTEPEEAGQEGEIAGETQLTF